MARRPLNFVIRDVSGVIVSNAAVTIKVHLSGAVATIYAAENGGSALAGGQVITDSSGSSPVWIEDTDYDLLTLFDVSSVGIATKTVNV
jgi:hypothetical protein